jgi:hypothetical protein
MLWFFKKIGEKMAFLTQTIMKEFDHNIAF